MYLWQIAYKLLVEIHGAKEAEKSSGHGADPLTSVGLYYFPELLRSDLMRSPQKELHSFGLKVTGFGQITYENAIFQAPVLASETAPDGVWGGDPKYCSAETGKILVDRLVKIGSGFIRDHVTKGFV